MVVFSSTLNILDGRKRTEDQTYVVYVLLVEHVIYLTEPLLVDVNTSRMIHSP